MADDLNELVEELKSAHADNLVSVVLYGSAAGGSAARGADRRAEPDAHDKNILVVLERITPADLRHAHEAAKRWRERGNPLPLYFTRAEIYDSADVFPVEFIDLSQVRRVLAGVDPFDGLRIPRRNLRHQLEYELRGKLIRVRALYVPTSHNAVRLGRLMYDSLMTYAVLFRHVISLFGDEPPFDKRECVLRLADLLGLDKKVFARVFEYASEDAAPLQIEVEETFAAYLAQIEAIIDRVNNLPVEQD